MAKEELKVHLDCPDGIIITVLRAGDSWEFRTAAEEATIAKPGYPECVAMIVQIGDHLRKQFDVTDTTTGGSIIMPIDISTEATTRSMIKNGRNSRKPISKARFNSEIMKAGTRIRSDISSGVAGGGSPDRSHNSLRSFSRTFFSMKPRSGTEARCKASSTWIWLAISGLMPSS